MNHFRQNFEEYLRIYNFTHRKIANILGVSNGTISNWRNGKHEPSYDMLIRISDLFDTTIDDLIR